MMGEYGTHKGSKIKMGTCENMYYLRWEDRHEVEPESGSLDPADSPGIRFRFPFPDEDAYLPGDDRYHERGYFRGLGLHGIDAPAEGVEHYSIQFRSTTTKGLLVSLPCPMGPDGRDKPYDIGFNGFSGAVEIVQQKPQDGVLMLILRCGCCGALWRCETLEMCSGVFAALLENATNADRRQARDGGNPCEHESARFYREIIRRIRAGYEQPAPVA